MNLSYKTFFSFLALSIIVFGQTNLIQNGDFENWVGTDSSQYWEFRTPGPQISATKDSTTIHNGSYSCKIYFTTTTQAETDFTNATSPVTEGIEYTYNAWIYDNDAAGRVTLVFAWFDAGMNFLSTDYLGSYSSDDANWQQMSHVATAPTGAAFGGARFRFYDVTSGWDGDCEIFIDEVEFLGPGSGAPLITNLTAGHFDIGVSIDISAEITDDQGINEAWLHFTSDFGATEDSVQMSNTTGNTWQGTIPTQPNNTGLEYWISALDIDSSPNYSVSSVQKTIVGIADISRAHEVDGSGNMLYEDFFAKIKGVVTVATGTFSATYQDDYMQDNTGGINIFDFSVIQTLSLGDSIEVSGRFSQFNSKSEILDFTINVLSTGNPVPNPAVITNVDMGEQYEGMLIRINQGLISNWDDTTSSSFDAIFTDASGDLTLHVDSDTDVPGHAAPTDFIDLVGIGSQYDYSAPYNDGFNVMPRGWADFLVPDAIDEEIKTAYTFSLKQNYPNPFNPNTNIEFTLAQNSDVKIVIYNLLGQEIKSFAMQKMDKGLHSFVWNGTDNRGYDVASGIYIYRITAGEFTSTKKMALLR